MDSPPTDLRRARLEREEREWADREYDQLRRLLADLGDAADLAIEGLRDEREKEKRQPQ